jgi:hypothetical protein
MATNNVYGNMLSRPTQAYTRQPGVASGLGQKQPQTCPTGYRYDTVQGKCVAVNTQPRGMWSGAGSAVTQPKAYTQPAQSSWETSSQPKWGMSSQPKAPAFQPYNLPKPNQLSPYAQLLAQAVDINLTNPAQPYPSQVGGQPLPTPAPVQQQLSINPDFLRLVNGR